MTTTTARLGTSAIDRFLQAAQSGTIPACTAWHPEATLDATVSNWRMRLTGADATRAEYARWFADPGHFRELRRHHVQAAEAGGHSEVVEYVRRRTVRSSTPGRATSRRCRGATTPGSSKTSRS